MKKPNILFIMTDQQRYDTLHANGNSIIKTPHLDALAAQSANFSNFFIQAPVCVPSRQTFFTGRYPHSHKNRVNYTMLDPSETLLQRYLQNVGFQTAFVGKLHYYPASRDFALSTGFGRGLIHDGGPADCCSDYVAWLRDNGFDTEKRYRACLSGEENPFINILPENLHETVWCGEKTRETLSDLSKNDSPFFLFSSYWRPHSPFEVPRPWADMYKDADIPLPDAPDDAYMNTLTAPVRELATRGGDLHNHDDRMRVLWEYRAYYAAISQIDDEIGKTLAHLRTLGLENNTIVIFASDHGDLMHEHGIIDKNVFFDPAVHVPFMIRWPDVINPRRYYDLTESTDVLATLFELCGLVPPARQQGRSFARYITGGALGSDYSPREYVFAENIIPEVITGKRWDYRYEKGKGVGGIRHPDAKMIRSKGWKYNYYPGSGEELYDLIRDAGENINRADDSACAGIKAQMKSALLDWTITADEADQIAPVWYLVKDAEGGWVSSPLKPDAPRS